MYHPSCYPNSKCHSGMLTTNAVNRWMCQQSLRKSWTKQSMFHPQQNALTCRGCHLMVYVELPSPWRIGCNTLYLDPCAGGNTGLRQKYLDHWLCSERMSNHMAL